MEVVSITNSGHFYKIIPNFGMLIYSPYNSLTYAIHSDFIEATIDFLNGSIDDKLPEEIKKPLLSGRGKNDNSMLYSTNHLLPNSSYWLNYSQPDETITINWFITGKCNFKCGYCYASDLMNDYIKEPIEEEIDNIAEQILKLKPLSVVLTGGEPFVSPHISKAIKLLSKRAGIIIDTNGSIINENLLNMISEHNVVVRISLDSPRPFQNFKHRIPFNKNEQTYNDILENIIKCLNLGIPVIIQTVVSSINKNELEEFGEILSRLGISGWRLLKVQESRLNTNVYKKLMLGRTKKIIDASKQLDYQLDKLIKIHKLRWSSKMSLQISKNSNNDKNSVILVSPNGEFWTESKIQNAKNLIDIESSKCPFEDAIFKKVSNFSHFSRYLNIY